MNASPILLSIKSDSMKCLLVNTPNSQDCKYYRYSDNPLIIRLYISYIRDYDISLDFIPTSIIFRYVMIISRSVVVRMSIDTE